MATPVAVRVSVLPVSQPSTPVNKRKITPSSEQSSSKRSLILANQGPSHISPGDELPTQQFSAPKQLFPHGIASVVHQYTHAHPTDHGEGEKGQIPWHNKRVLLPFDLRDSELNWDRPEVKSLLYSIFPGTKNVAIARHGSHPIFQVKELPSKPWPLSIGGLPYTILADGNRGSGRALIFPRQNLGCSKEHVASPLYVRNSVCAIILRSLAETVNGYFMKQFSIRIVELIYTCEQTFYVVLDDHFNINAVKAKLPFMIANCPAGYLNDKDLHRPAWADRPAGRIIEPQPSRGIVDDTVYNTMRPGTMGCSMVQIHSHPATASWTTGVLVKNAVGTKLMTAPSHGIGENELVFQPGHASRPFGRAVIEIPFTDVSLVQLTDDTVYVNETFDNESGNVPIFTELITSGENLNWRTCFLNSCYTGNMEGAIMAHSVRIEGGGGADPTDDGMRYVVYNWAYVGQEDQEEGRIPEGTCGSAIWDDNGVILGFFHYLLTVGPWKGFAASVSACEVADASYTLA